MAKGFVLRPSNTIGVDNFRLNEPGEGIGALKNTVSDTRHNVTFE
jgi:hypothetical protein